MPGNLYEPFVDVSELGDGVCACHSAFRPETGTSAGKSMNPLLMYLNSAMAYVPVIQLFGR